jgi:thiol:disulfide interchange protein DsbC
MKILLCFILIFFCLNLSPVYAEKNTEAEKNIKNTLSVLIPDEAVTRIRTTPFNNLYEVLIGPNVIYMSGDGRYILKGDLLDMQARTNLSENERALAREYIFKNLTKNEYIEFSPVNPEHIIYVFTDVDCSYCRRLHRDVPVLNEHGVGIRYLAYPRAGIGSRTATMMQAVWCSADRKQALTDAKNGKNITVKQCKNPIEKEYQLGQRIGVRGTPAIYTENGEELSGYMPPEELINVVTNY